MRLAAAAGARRLFATGRVGNWWFPKLPPLLAVAYAHLLVHGTDPRAAFQALGPALLALCAVAWYAHVVNDLCDVDDDRRCGKPNRVAGLSRFARWTVVLSSAGLGLAVTASLLGDDSTPVVIVAGNLLVFTLYSVPPFRLKRRRWWGVAADALGAHALPMLFILSAMPGDSGGNVRDVLLTVSALTWSLIAGVRGILVHQIADRQGDQVAGLATVGTTMAPARIRGLVLRKLLPLEAGALLAFVVGMAPNAPVLVVAAILFCVVEATRMRRRWRLPLFEPAETSDEPYRPLLNNDAYELWLPNALALQLAFAGGGYLALPPLQILLFLPGTRKRVAEIWKLAPFQRAARTAADQQSESDAGSTIRKWRSPMASKGEVVIGSAYWVVNGVNVFSANLARGLATSRLSTQVLLTESATRLISFHEALMPRPEDVRFVELGVRAWEPWGAHWGEMVHHLESLAPCVYVPNADWRHSCVCPLLSDRVGIVGIVHSDDPLHYDHVRRLGAYWNTIVAVSEMVAERTAELLPMLERRIVTIPIGARIPQVCPPRSILHDHPLRLVYHGALKKHQKRVLDLPRIMEALAEMRVPARLTIAGAGVDEQELRERAQPLVDRGLVQFLGVVDHDEIPQLLAGSDVYLLPSEFEGMPNALIEAMGNGVVPVVTRIASGVSELVRDGENGFLVPVGDIAAFADRLRLLQQEPETRARLSAAAFRAVKGTYRLENMVADYRALFERVLEDARRRRFIRPRGELAHPPASLNGTSLFPVGLSCHVPGVGRFPTEYDFECFSERLVCVPQADRVLALPNGTRRRRGAGASPLSDLNVVVAAPLWLRIGVNVQSCDLVRGLRARGLNARLLLTEEKTDLVSVDAPRLTLPSDLPLDFLPVERTEGWGAHWGAMVRYLEDRAPCVYLPTFDWRHSCILPRLSRDVLAVGTAYAGDPLTLEQIQRLAPYWNAVVVRDAESAQEVKSIAPMLSGPLAIIPDGLSIPIDLSDVNRDPEGPFELLAWTDASGGAAAEQIRAVVAALRERGITTQVSILGVEGRPELAASDLGAPGQDVIPRLPWPTADEAFQSSAALLAWLHDDAVPTELWRAMGWGCVPLVILNGNNVPGSLRDGENCYLVRCSDAASVAGQLARLLEGRPRRASMSVAAHRAALNAMPTEQAMLDRYLDLFETILLASRDGSFTRPIGPVLPPPPEIAGTSIFPVSLGHEVPGLGRFPSTQDQAEFLARSQGSWSERAESEGSPSSETERNVARLA